MSDCQNKKKIMKHVPQNVPRNVPRNIPQIISQSVPYKMQLEKKWVHSC